MEKVLPFRQLCDGTVKPQVVDLWLRKSSPIWLKIETSYDGKGAKTCKLRIRLT
jgi:hypothetical protein